MKSSVAVYPGSFDPLTNGHVDVIRRGLIAFDRIIVAVATNTQKTPLFTKQERMELIRATFPGDTSVEVEAFDGLLVDYLREKDVHVVIRGLRAVSDFEYEFQMASMNRKLHPKMETFFMMAGEEHFYLSANVVKEIARLGGPIDALVPATVEPALLKKLGR